ncbi:MAG TPA: ankyrin repeat domain-containing protein, partial [Armatimonadota bacterium]|nr:ankyrin repeat domain-containing protein [Armatimonadota bacterium]
PSKRGQELLDAAGSGNYREALSLLRRGVSVHVRAADGRTPLIHAAMYGQAKVMELLIRRGARLEDHDRDGNTALLIATDAGQVPAVRLLLDRGANRRARNHYGSTALWLTGRDEHPGGAAEYRVIRRLLLARSGKHRRGWKRAPAGHD